MSGGQETLAEKMRFRIGYSQPQRIAPSIVQSRGVVYRYQISEPSLRLGLRQTRMYYKLPYELSNDMPVATFVHQLFGRLVGIVVSAGPWSCVRVNGKGLVLGMGYSPEMAAKLCSKT